MKKKVAALTMVACLVATTGCTKGLNDNKGPAPAASVDKTPVTITMSSFFTDREKTVIDKALEQFHKSHDWITVKHNSGQERDAQLQSMRSSASPDLMMYGQSSDVPQLCKSGSFIPLGQYMERDKISKDSYIPATMEYSSWKDTVCALPMLSDVYALYYDKKVLAQAGIQPPKTLEELNAAAKKLTIKNPDGSLKRVGFMPLLDYAEMNARTMTVPFDLKWVDDQGKAQIDKDENWAKMLTWQKSLIKEYGQSQLKTFRSKLGDEFSSSNPFYTGQVPMMMDGEWRVAFLKNEKPDLDYGVVPMPALDPAKGGGGFVSGVELGIPQKSQHREAAWELAKFLSTDTKVLQFLTNELANFPATKDGIKDPAIRKDERFAALLDMAANPNSRSVPNTLAGAAPGDIFAQNVGTWQWGSSDDPKPFLADMNKRIDGVLAQSGR